MKKELLYETREEYQAFDLKVFRDHIYQEVKRRERKESKDRFAKMKNRSTVGGPAN